MLHPIMSTQLANVYKFNSRQVRDVGIELEIEGAGIPRDNPPGWSYKEEHSLRGDCGEFVTRGAVKRSDIIKTVENLNEFFKKVGATVKPSDRCSTHIHLNMQDETFRVLYGTILVFTICEPILLRLCGTKRNGNLFCMPSYETGDLRRAMHHSSDYVSRGMHYDWYQRGKYAALCTDHVPSLGTLEARCFPLSTDPAVIDRWASWLCRMREVARDWKTEDYSDLGTTPETIIFHVFSGTNVSYACAPDNIYDLMNLGAETAYEAWRGLESVMDYNENKPKKILKRRLPPPEFEGNYSDG